jgi:hypothetical protein
MRAALPQGKFGLVGVEEDKARHIVRQVLLALSFLHHNLEDSRVYHAGEWRGG